jgi:putative redox protein
MLVSPDAADADVQKAIRMSEESLCPVWAMLKGSVEIVSELKLSSG